MNDLATRKAALQKRATEVEAELTSLDLCGKLQLPQHVQISVNRAIALISEQDQLIADYSTQDSTREHQSHGND